MLNPKLSEIIENINEHIVRTQKLNVELQEKSKKQDSDLENTLQEASLKIIDILDFIYSIKKTIDIKNLQIILDKIVKKLTLFLESIGVKEIVLEKNFLLDAQLTRVVDLKKASCEEELGRIIEICRRGYMRGGKIIRPVDVITAK